ncbi:hypothetical protein [Chitinophaga qingshengii]|uniref:Uncharacterized protein n=1 Tax=Chitinophaga qingshengii TaxID=1569794 RepID=A0ABR7TSN7_9BACT|nr:hypothetical protein [Chitinophaga qingshengii]MBC9933018.1 hypothetical protein [Chitinophaga qingshengii]
MTDLWTVQTADMFVKFAVSERYVIGSLHENGYLFHLDTHEVTFMNWFYGDPTCAIIGQNDQWATMGGANGLTIWQQGVTSDIHIENVFALREFDPVTIHVLTDPWREEAAVWEINLVTFSIQRLRSFPDYLNQEYTDDVNW